MHPITTPPSAAINDLLLISPLSITPHYVSSHASFLPQKFAHVHRFQHIAGLKLQLRTALAEGKRRRRTTSMMDEIELQLCLSIDPTSARDPTPNDENQKPKQTPSPVKHKQQLQILGAKRPAESLESDGDVDKPRAQERSVNMSHSLKPAYQDGDSRSHDEKTYKVDHDPDPVADNGRPSPFQLPPRKKVRTSFSFPPESTSPCAMTADEPNASQDTVHNTTPASESFSSQPYFAHPASVPQPSSPSPQFPERSGQVPETVPRAYMPALLDSLSSGLRPYPPGLEAPTRQAQYFEIYEDPEDMDIDGVGYFDLDSVLCMSPDEDKENEHAGEQGSQGQIQNQTQAQTQNRESNPDQGQQDQG